MGWRRGAGGGLERDGPLILDEGYGVYVKDLEGNEYIEGMAGLWCAALGFSNERLIQAAVTQMRKLPTYHTFFQCSTMPTIDLAERLLDSAPVPMARVWFANSGSEANDHMCKFVWYYNNARGRPEKKKIIAREHGYHGIAVSSGSLTGLPAMHKGFDLPIPTATPATAPPTRTWRCACSDIRTCATTSRPGRSGGTARSVRSSCTGGIESTTIAQIGAVPGPDAGDAPVPHECARTLARGRADWRSVVRQRRSFRRR